MIVRNGFQVWSRYPMISSRSWCGALSLACQNIIGTNTNSTDLSLVFQQSFRSRWTKAQKAKWRRKWIDNYQTPHDEKEAYDEKKHLLEAFREHPTSVSLEGGEILMGKVVTGAGSKFSKVDFGLKAEVSFPREELLGSQGTGSQVAYPLIRLEDEFKEAEIDYSRATALPTLQAERLQILSGLFKQTDALQILRGRVVRKVASGFVVRILGYDFFCPQSLILGMPTPQSGRYYNFVMVNAESRALRDSASSAGSVLTKDSQQKVVFTGLVSAYASNIVTLCNLVADDEAWKASGGGSAKDRLAYLRMLTAIIMKKNFTLRQFYYLKVSRKPFATRLIDADPEPNSRINFHAPPRV